MSGDDGWISCPFHSVVDINHIAMSDVGSELVDGVMSGMLAECMANIGFSELAAGPVG